MINNSISVKISRLQNGRFFPQKLVCMARSASVIIGSLRNDDADGNDDAIKQ